MKNGSKNKKDSPRENLRTNQVSQRGIKGDQTRATNFISRAIRTDQENL